MIETPTPQKNGARRGQATSCRCGQCAQLCERNPGWMTPQEADAAITAGLGRRLMRDWLEADAEVGDDKRIYLLCPASIGSESGDAPEAASPIDYLCGWSKGRCTFLKNGRCEIHKSGFKPKQCREAFGCDDKRNESCADNYAMARLWRTGAARKVLRRWKRCLSADVAAPRESVFQAKRTRVK